MLPQSLLGQLFERGGLVGKGRVPQAVNCDLLEDRGCEGILGVGRELRRLLEGLA